MNALARAATLAGWAGRYLWSAWAGAAGLFCLAAAWQGGHELYGSFILPAPLETLRAVGDPAFHAELRAGGLEPAPASTPEQTAAFIAAEIARWRPVVAAAGARID